MKGDFPAAVPEIPVNNVNSAAGYYKERLGFNIDWGDEGGGGIAGISRGRCRMFLTSPEFRQMYGNLGPVLVWLNLTSREEVDDLHHQWSSQQVKIVSPPESKPWKLHEFTAADLDGNLLRVFYDFAWETK
jgi:predicted lactoylglutathione lyase